MASTRVSNRGHLSPAGQDHPVRRMSQHAVLVRCASNAELSWMLNAHDRARHAARAGWATRRSVWAAEAVPGWRRAVHACIRPMWASHERFRADRLPGAPRRRRGAPHAGIARPHPRRVSEGEALDRPQSLAARRRTAGRSRHPHGDLWVRCQCAGRGQADRGRHHCRAGRAHWLRAVGRLSQCASARPVSTQLGSSPDQHPRVQDDPLAEALK
jgi:hypothetical protein